MIKCDIYPLFAGTFYRKLIYGPKNRVRCIEVSIINFPL